MKDEKISVIVPVYNVEKFIVKCTNSILNQTYANIELVLVDDGSTDMSGKICDNIAESDSRVKVVHKENGGLSSARNVGINVATGDFYGFVDSDDYIELTMYEILLNAINRTGKDIATCGRVVNVFGQFDNEEFTLREEKIFSREDAIAEVLMLEKIDVSACDKLYKKELFEKIRYPEGKISEDAAVIFDVLQKSNGIVHVGKPLYHYVFFINSITKAKYSAKRHDVVDNIKRTDNFIYHNYPRMVELSNIYGCICSAALLLVMYEDKDAVKQYPEHYKDYKFYFNRGVRSAVKCKHIRKRMKARLIAIKTHTLPLFYIAKYIYDLKKRSNDIEK